MVITLYIFLWLYRYNQRSCVTPHSRPLIKSKRTVHVYMVVRQLAALGIKHKQLHYNNDGHSLWQHLLNLVLSLQTSRTKECLGPGRSIISAFGSKIKVLLPSCNPSTLPVLMTLHSLFRRLSDEFAHKGSMQKRMTS